MEFYRYDSINYHEIGVRVHEYKFDLLNETPCGYWIYQNYTDDKRWVSKTARKRFAYPSREEAMTSFIARKKCQIRILETQLENAKSALHQGKVMQEKEEASDGRE
jgi:hypothetical protein